VILRRVCDVAPQAGQLSNHGLASPPAFVSSPKKKARRDHENVPKNSDEHVIISIC
jgi:hypothetical protein